MTAAAEPDIHRTVEDLAKYEAGFVTDIESDKAPKGVSEEIIRFISAKKEEPGWLLEWRLKAYRHWLKMPEPDWAMVDFPPIDYQDAYYYAAPKQKLSSIDEADPKLLETFEKLGVPMRERARLAGVAVDVVFDSVSVATTFKDDLKKMGIIFCSISDAVREHPELVQKYMGSVVPVSRQQTCVPEFGGVYGWVVRLYPAGVRCPMELSTYFRINERIRASLNAR
jgi:Fe-S cluster assembly protein SufB